MPAFWQREAFSGFISIHFNVGIGTTSFGASAAKVLSIGVGTKPSTGATDAIQIYATATDTTAECYIMDEAGNATLQTPHDKVTGEWIFYSKNIKTGRVVRVDMERMVKAIERVTGEQFMVETWEAAN